MMSGNGVLERVMRRVVRRGGEAGPGVHAGSSKSAGARDGRTALFIIGLTEDRRLKMTGVLGQKLTGFVDNVLLVRRPKRSQSMRKESKILHPHTKASFPNTSPISAMSS